MSPPPSSSGDERAVSVARIEWKDRERRDGSDLVTREEPLEIQLGGVPLAVVMRTPGNDEELVWGFLTTERVVSDASAVQSVRHCSTAPSPEAEENVVQVVLAPGIEVDLARLQRNLYASSSCGICGKATIENALAVAPPLDDPSIVDVEVLLSLPDKLRAGQSVFTRTGGLHAAGIFTLVGEPIVVREDVGRHNAVDKVIGWSMMNRSELSGHVLMVSGRVSYEIAQKALAARIPIVAAVSAPSSLSIELATSAAMTLIGFVRDRRLCVYAGGERVRGV